MSERELPGVVDEAQFRALVHRVRPELHRYCARLTGSVIDGEDVVQDTLIRAFAALRGQDPPQAFRPWLFHVAHNRALDLLRSRAIRAAVPLAAEAETLQSDAPDPLDTLLRREAVHTAVSRFVELSVAQRSSVILKDVLGESLADIAALLDTTVDAVKAHLARGRAKLSEINARATLPRAARPPSPEVVRYVDLFNNRDWDGLRAMLASDVKLQQATYRLRVGATDVGMFFSVYAQSEPVRLVPATLDGIEVIAVFENAALTPTYLMWLEWDDGRISFIHDYRYARHIVEGAELVIADTPQQQGR